jgi:diamine N-acetyltransferase
MEVIFTSGDERLLDNIAPLWDKLRNHHLERTRNFAWHYQSQTFANRKEALFHKTKNGKIRVELVNDRETGTLVGYCISSITDDRIGELESMFVEACCRSMGVGQQLVKSSLDWMTEEKVTIRRVVVNAGNEEVLGFYRRFGFYPRSQTLEYVPDGLARSTLTDHVSEAR